MRGSARKSRTRNSGESADCRDRQHGTGISEGHNQPTRISFVNRKQVTDVIILNHHEAFRYTVNYSVIKMCEDNQFLILNWNILFAAIEVYDAKFVDLVVGIWDAFDYISHWHPRLRAALPIVTVDCGCYTSICSRTIPKQMSKPALQTNRGIGVPDNGCSFIYNHGHGKWAQLKLQLTWGQGGFCY